MYTMQIRESVKGVKDSAEALKLYEDFVTQKVCNTHTHTHRPHRTIPSLYLYLYLM